jgi:hypothetical protein
MSRALHREVLAPRLGFPQPCCLAHRAQERERLQAQRWRAIGVIMISVALTHFMLWFLFGGLAS